MIELKELERESAAEVARKALAEIQAEDEDGLLKAESVVDHARHPDHPLHRFFTWDDGAAAEQWRQMQARQLIRKVQVIGPNDEEEDSAPIPKYVSLRSDRRKPGGGYRDTRQVLNNKQLLAELEETAKKDIEATLQRYQMLEKLVAKVRAAAGIKVKKQAKKSP